MDKAGQTVDFRLRTRRDVAAAKAFFRKAIRHEGRTPHTITLDGYAASHRAVRKMRTDGLLPKRTKLRSSRYLNNLIEQGHRGIKSRTRPMLGFKNFACAATTIAGIELLRRIRKDQFALGRFNLHGPSCACSLEFSPGCICLRQSIVVPSLNICTRTVSGRYR